MKVETFRIDYLIRTPTVEKLSLQPISYWILSRGPCGETRRVSDGFFDSGAWSLDCLLEGAGDLVRDPKGHLKGIYRVP